MSEDVEMAPPSCVNEAIFDIGEGNSVRLISLYHEIGTDLNIKGGTEVPSNQLAADLARTPSAVGTQVNNPGNDRDVENSGCGRRKRAPRHIGALNRCLCGIVVDPNVNLGDAIQSGCETRWVRFIFPYRG